MLIPRTPSPVRTLPAPAITPATPRVAELAVLLEERPVEELTMKEMQELVKRHQVALVIQDHNPMHLLIRD